MARRRVRARVNRAVRWVGLPTVAVVALLYALSRDRVYSAVAFPTRRDLLAVGIRRGTATLSVDHLSLPQRPTSRIQWSVMPAARYGGTPGYDWWFGARRTRDPAGPGGRGGGSGSGIVVVIPLWFFAAAALGAGEFARRRRRREQEGLSCPSCGYNLSGLPPGSPCPECAAPERPAPGAASRG